MSDYVQQHTCVATLVGVVVLPLEEIVGVLKGVGNIREGDCVGTERGRYPLVTRTTVTSNET